MGISLILHSPVLWEVGDLQIREVHNDVMRTAPLFDLNTYGTCGGIRIVPHPTRVMTCDAIFC